MADKPGRPKVLVRRHILEIKEDTQEWIESQISRVLAITYAGKATRSAGEIIKGAVSHPVGYVGITILIAAVAVALKGGDTARSVQNLETAFLKLTPEEAAAFKKGVQGIVDFFGGLFQAPPPGEGAPLPPL